MRNTKLYNGWEPSRPEVNGRSYLVHLPPIGIGTPAVESLTGYIARLAAAHAVETGVLVHRELLPRIPRTRGVLAGQLPVKMPAYSCEAHVLNGSGDRSRLWVSLLEQLTCIHRLDLLTALPWATTISCVHLLRPHRAWCSSCYGEKPSQAESAYERLLWTFQLVTVCPVHGRPLDTVCPSCSRTQYVLSAKLRPGYCSRCQCWLGRANVANTSGDHQTEQIRVAEMVGQLLAESPSVPAGFGADLFRDNVRTAGGLRDIRHWIRRAAIPRMNSLVSLSLSCDIPLLHFVTERIESHNNAEPKHSPKAHHRVADRIVEGSLRTALAAVAPPPLCDVANGLGYRTVAALQGRYRALCGEIANKRRLSMEGPGQSSGKAPTSRDTIERALAEDLEKDHITSILAVAASVGLSNKRRLYKGFHDVRGAIVAKNKRIRQRQREAMESALRDAFAEQPIPTVTEVSRRLGFACVTGVTSRFPELTAELRRSRQAQLPKGGRRTEHIRQKLAEALKEFPPAPCSEIVRRFAGHRTEIREGFPDLWRALRARYAEHKRDVQRSKREAISSEVLRAVVGLRRKGVNPTIRLVLASIPERQRRSPGLVEKAVRAVKRELSTGS
jgi:phage terminase Nu1 subunit (DNA packaging protein)